jgi:hypothetical protein
MTYDRPIGIAPLPAVNAAAARPRVNEVLPESESFHQVLDRQESEPISGDSGDHDAEWKAGKHSDQPETRNAEDPRNPRTAAPVAVAEPGRPSEPAAEPTGRVDGSGEQAGSNEISRVSPSSNPMTAGRDAANVTSEDRVPAGGFLIDPTVAGDQAAPELALANLTNEANLASESIGESEMPVCEAPANEQVTPDSGGEKASRAKLSALSEMVRPVGKAVTAALAMLRAAGRVSEQNLEEQPAVEAAEDGSAAVLEPVRQSTTSEPLPVPRPETPVRVRRTGDELGVATRLVEIGAQYREAAAEPDGAGLSVARQQITADSAEVEGQGRVANELQAGPARQSVLEGVLTPMARPASRTTEAETPVSKSAQVLEMLNARAAVRAEAVRRPEPVSPAERGSGFQPQHEPASSAVMPQVVTRVSVPANLAPAATPTPVQAAPGMAAAARLEALDRPVFQTASPLKSVSIPVGDELRPSAVIHLLQQTAGVKVTVQSADAGLSQALRAELPQLVSRLEDAGFQSNFQHRGAAPADPAAAGILRSGSSSMRDSGFQESGTRDGQADAAWSGRQQQQQRQSRLWKDLLQDERQHAKEGA